MILSTGKGESSLNSFQNNSIVGPAIVAVVATFFVLSTLSPNRNGPGVTCDEYYDVAAGKQLVSALIDQGTGFFQAENIEQTFGPLTRHPPLGRWLLGWVHAPLDPQPDDLRVVSVVAGRFAPAFAFGALILLIGWATGREGEPLRGTFAALAVALTPRLFGHAHLATLDTFTALFFVAAVIALPIAVKQPLSVWRAALAGVVWGLALLTKLHGVLVLVPATIWFFWQFGWAAVRLWVAWLLAGLATFFVGWPWLWHDTLARLQEYFSTATERQSLHTFYMGRIWADIEVPWHYPWAMFLVTLPVGFLLLGVWGLWSQRRHILSDPLLSLALGSILFLLLVFSLPNTPVYDGVRLFLMVFPLWAIFVGYGAQAATVWLGQFIKRPLLAKIIVGGFVLLQGGGLFAYHPYYLSHFSLLVGGLPGAERLGFEVTYWGETVNGELLEAAHRADPEGVVLYAPHLAPFQAAAVEISSPELQDTRLLGWDPNQPELIEGSNYALVYRRNADGEALEPLVENAEVVAEVQRQGVWVARLYRLP